jgi:hypothetical protein
MVQITTARTFNPETGQWGDDLPAEDYDADKHGHLECVCPDPHCSARLQRKGSYHQTFYDSETGEPYRLKIPSHYQRKPGAVEHDEKCEIYLKYGSYQDYCRHIGGLGTSDGAFIFNLNIDSDTQPAPIRERKEDMQDSFSKANGSGEKPDKTRKRRRSEGIKNIDVLATLIEKSAFDSQLRESLLFRRAGYNGHPTISLSLDDLYIEDQVDFFRRAHAATKENRLMTAAFLFKPIKIAKYWHTNKDGTGVVYGQAKPVSDADGNKYYVNIALRVRDKDLFARLKQDVLKGGEGSFLVYSEEIRVDLMSFAHKKMEIIRGTAEDKGVHADVYINTGQQIVPWQPPPMIKEMELDAERSLTRKTGMHATAH